MKLYITIHFYVQIFRPSKEKNEWSGSGIVFFDTWPIGLKYNKNKYVYFYLFNKKKIINNQFISTNYHILTLNHSIYIIKYRDLFNKHIVKAT